MVPPGVIHHLLSLLSVRELCKVAGTCSSLREAVKEFLRHEIASLHLEELMTSFRERHGKGGAIGGLLTQEERRILYQVQGREAEERKMIQQFRMVSSGRKWKAHFGQQIDRRVSCASPAVWIPHKDNSAYFETKFEHTLRREVVELRTVCWLEVTHLLEGVGEGTWEVAIRLKLTDRFTWPHQEGQMSSWKVEDEEVKVGRQWWRALKAATIKEKLEVKERVMGKELRAEIEVEEETAKPTGCFPGLLCPILLSRQCTMTPT